MEGDSGAGWKSGVEEQESGGEVVERVLKMVKGLLGDVEGELGDQVVKGIAEKVREEFGEEVRGSKFLMEVLTEL